MREQKARYEARGGLLGGSGDLVSGLIMGISGFTIWVLEVINPLTKYP